MNCSTPGLPVHHHLPEFTQTHVHRVGDSIQSSHPLLSPSPPAPNPSQYHSLSQWVNSSHQFSSVSLVQSLSRVRLFATPWIAARQASLSITISRSSLRLTSIESVMPSSHLILGHPLLLLPPISLSIRIFSNESTLCMRWPKYWSFSFSTFLPKDTQDWSPLELTGWNFSQSKGPSRVFSNTTVRKHQFFGAQPS